MLKYSIYMLFFIYLCTFFRECKNALTHLLIYFIKNKTILFTTNFFRDKISLVRKRNIRDKVESLYESEYL